MKVCVYAGSEKLIAKSGVGKAIANQTYILKKGGHDVVPKLTKDVDIVHLNTIFPDSVLTALRAKAQKTAVIYYGHSTMEDFRKSFKCSDLLAPLFKQWIMFCYQCGDVIITPTEYSRRILLGYGIRKPVYALSNGIDTDFFCPDPKGRTAFRKRYHLSDSDKVVISVGHFMERKGILDFIRLAKRFPKVKFFWFGYTAPALVPKKICDAMHHAPENLTFAGYVDSKALREAYQGCDLFCFMSHEETEGIVILEALACGTPILVRDIPVYEGWLYHGKNVYKASDAGDFYRCCRSILFQKPYTLSKEGRKTALDRRFEKICERLEDIYTELMKKP